MKTSEQINELAQALSLAQGEIDDAIADAKNPHFKSTYADLTSVRRAIRKPLSSHGLSIVQLPVTIDGKPALTSRMMHKSGQWIEDSVMLVLEKPTMQGLGSAITYAKRYCLAAMVGLAETDDDGNTAERYPIQEPVAATVTSINKQPVPNPAPVTIAPPQSGVTDKQRKMVWAKLKTLGHSDEAAKKFLTLHSGKEHSADWSKQDFNQVLRAIDEISPLPEL